MSNDLGVGLSDKLVVLLPQVFLEIEVVLDNAVMDDDDAAGAVTVRMRILFRRAPVRRPACVTHAVGAVDGMLTQSIFEVAQLAFGAFDLQLAIFIDYRNAG